MDWQKGVRYIFFLTMPSDFSQGSGSALDHRLANTKILYLEALVVLLGVWIDLPNKTSPPLCTKIGPGVGCTSCSFDRDAFFYYAFLIPSRILKSVIVREREVEKVFLQQLHLYLWYLALLTSHHSFRGISKPFQSLFLSYHWNKKTQSLPSTVDRVTLRPDISWE